MRHTITPTPPKKKLNNRREQKDEEVMGDAYGSPQKGATPGLYYINP